MRPCSPAKFLEVLVLWLVWTFPYQCCATASQKSGASHVFLVAADALCLPFPNQSIHCVTCLFGLMFFPRPVSALCELRRVLALRGRAALTMWACPERAPFAG